MNQHRARFLRLHSVARQPLLGAALPLCMALAACSGNVVNMGENDGDSDSPSPPSGSRCANDPTLAGDVVVRTQAELDALEGCTTIDGHLVVEPFFQPDLRPLHELRAVRGELAFGGPNYLGGSREVNVEQEEAARELLELGFLPSLEGLEQLEEVGGLVLASVAADSLAPLAQLRHLTESGNLTITSDTITDLSPLSQLQGIQYLTLEGDGIESLDGLNIGYRLGSLSLGATRLANIDALSGLRIIGGVVIYQTALRDLAPLAQLQTAGPINIARNPALETLHGLDALTVVESVILNDNDALEDTSALNELVFVQTLMVAGNDNLRRLPEFPSLKTQSLFISDNPLLEALPLLQGTYAGLEEASPEKDLVRARGQIEIVRNASLQSFSVPLSWSGADYVVIEDNTNLRELDLSDLTAIDLLQLNDNPALDTVLINQLDTVDTLEVTNNPLLAPATFDPVRTFERNMSGNAGVAP